jgi:hypothetical protein
MTIPPVIPGSVNAAPFTQDYGGQHGSVRSWSSPVPDQGYLDVAAEFSPQEIAALVSLIVAINAWNAIGVSTRAWAPGSYTP